LVRQRRVRIDPVNGDRVEPYTDEQRARWKEAPARAAREDLSPAIE
jgi:hypothetical protein